MKTLPLEDQENYINVMEQIEKLLQKSANLGGFDKISLDDAEKLSDLSLLAEEQFENSIPLMPILK